MNLTNQIEMQCLTNQIKPQTLDLINMIPTVPPQRSTCKAFKASEEIKIREWEKDSGGTRK